MICGADPDGWGPFMPSGYDFTPCFEQTIITNLPTIYSFVFGSYWIYTLHRATLSRRPQTDVNPHFLRSWLRRFLSYALLIVMGFYAIRLSLLTMTIVVYPYRLMAAWLAVGAQAAMIWLVSLENHLHLSSTSTPNIYWLMVMGAYTVRLQTWLRRNVINDDPFEFGVLLAILVLPALLFIADNLPPLGRCCSLAGYQPLSTENEAHASSPESTSTFLSRITFSWMNHIMILGYKKPLAEEDLWSLRRADEAHTVSEQFQKEWQFEIIHKEKPSLVRALAQSMGGPFLYAALLKFSQDGLQYMQPKLLKILIEFVKAWSIFHDDTNPPTPPPAAFGITVACVMFILAVIQSSMLHQYFHRCLVTGMHMRAALVTAVYKKALRLSNASRQKSTIGEIVNHMSVDAQRIMDLIPYLHILWSGPFQIGLALYFLYQEMGPSIFAGLGVMVAMIPVNAFLSTRQRKYQKVQMKNKDNRMKLIEESLSGIKVIKLYAWEPAFQLKIENVRKKELETLKSIGYLSAIQSFTWSCTPFMVCFATFALYCVIGEEPFDATKIFVSLSLFNMLQFPLNMFPMVIASVVEASVALKRLYHFLMSEELDPEAVDRLDVSSERKEDPAIRAPGVSFSWLKDGEIILHDLNFTLKKGQLMGVVGKVGSGKSSILSAILGEMYRVDTDGDLKIAVRGSLAFVGQQAWIMNATLRENILFGKQYDEQLYQTTIDACGLRPDMEMLPGGDLTEIGERGINLSGGQKQRISFARAVYAQADIYLLDDPLSAVDAHVGRHIFNSVIGSSGLLKNKARFFVTHAIQFLPECDQIMMVNGGRIVEGPASFRTLMGMKENGNVWQLVNEFIETRAESSDKEEDVITLDELAEKAGVRLSSSVQSAKSNLSVLSVRKEKSRTPTPATVLKEELKNQTSEPVTQLMVKEETAKGSVSKDVYWSYVKACSWPAVVATIIMMIVGQLTTTGSDVWLERWGSHPESASTWLYLGVYGSFGLLFAILVVAQVIFVWVFCAIRSSRVLHHDLLMSIMHEPMWFFDTTPLGRIVNRFSKDIYTVDEVLPRSFMSYFRTLFSVIAIIFVIIISTPLFLLFVIPMGFLYFFVQRYYLSSSREIKRLDSVSRSPIYAHFSETLGGVGTIRAYNQIERFESENELRLDSNQRAYYPSIASNRWLAIRLEFIGGLVIFGSAMFAVISVVYFGNITAGMAGLSISYALKVTTILNWMVRMSCEIETNIVSVERVKEYIDLKQEAAYVLDGSRPIENWPSRGAVEFYHYSTRYRDEMDLILKNISFSTKPGEKIGIVGRTGAGKSSLLLGLFRLIEPASGTILIDGIDITTLGLKDLRSNITIIPQDPVLFGGTVRENLDPMHVCTDQELWTALENSHMSQKISSIEGKLDGEILQGGENFSVGQRQLICLARALLRRSKVLVLDEATAAIDVETDSFIQETIRKEFKSCTVLTIAHRINTVMDSDRILVLDKGQIAEFDSPVALLKNTQSQFYGLAKEANLA